jgi:hypothetical protein
VVYVEWPWAAVGLKPFPLPTRTRPHLTRQRRRQRLHRDVKIGQIDEGTSNLPLQTIAKQLLS